MHSYQCIPHHPLSHWWAIVQQTFAQHSGAFDLYNNTVMCQIPYHHVRWGFDILVHLVQHGELTLYIKSIPWPHLVPWE